ncbi:MAG: dihydrofolate reductase [Candidatus Nanohaloarchaea archaeon]
MEKIIIAAVAENGVIGEDGDIPWHYREDMQHFRETTTGNPVVMGRRTYMSIPEQYRPLDNRDNIVLSETLEELDGAEVAGDLEEAWELAEGHDQVYVAGGASVYEQALDEADRMVLTEIHEEYEGDSYFPEWGEEWEEVAREDLGELSFVEYIS